MGSFDATLLDAFMLATNPTVVLPSFCPHLKTQDWTLLNHSLVFSLAKHELQLLRIRSIINA